MILATASGMSSFILAGIASETDTRAEQYFEKANELRKAADYDTAITEYKKVMSLSPKSQIAQDAQYWIGQSYFEARQFDAALSAFQKLHDEYPESRTIPATTLAIERVQQAQKNKSLFEAVKKADVEQVKLFIAEGADVDAKWRDIYNENEGNKRYRTESTLLCYAVNGGKAEVVRLLVEAGADVNAGSWPPLCRAVDENNTGIAEYLIDHGANVNVYTVEVEDWGPLQETVHISNSIEMAKLLIARGADINSKGYPVLNSAINQERRDLCEFLMQRGADVNAKDKWGNTSLYLAIRNDDSDIMNILIANGAEVDIKHTRGETEETALHYAAITGRTEAVKLLLEAGANINDKNDKGQTALHLAVDSADGDIVELLLSKGADINAKDKQGHTPLYFAVNHDYKVAELLINKGADSGIRTESGQTLLQLAQQRKQAESTVPDMIFDGDPNSLFGLPIVCGDVDGDGYDDILIGAFRYNNIRGRVYLFYGGPDMDTTADLILEGQNEGDKFGNGIACGDVDNAGYADIVIAAGNYSELRGRAYLYWGSDRNSMDANPDKIFVGEQEKGSQFGAGHPAVYDIDNDGYDDIILGAVRGGGDFIGRTYLYYGNTKELMDTSHDHIFTGENPRHQFGFTISCGDVDNDGYGDIVIGPLHNRGRAYLYCGGSQSNMDAKADLIFEAQSEGANYFGQGIVCIDQNRDGYDDIVIGAPRYNERQGRSYFFHGNSKKNLDADPDMTFEGEIERSNYGARMICGDIDGDHVNDLVIGANGSGQRIGRVYVYWGKKLAGPDPKPGRILTGENPHDAFGPGLACGDINNDGFDDLVIGANGYKAGAKQGRAYLYYGGPKDK
jgi:ankyrin repeat protein